MIPHLSAIARYVRKFEAFVLSASILGIAALAIANVLTRTIVGSSIAAAEEWSQFLIIAITFVGVGYAAGLKRHIRMTAITEQLPATARSWWERMVCAGSALLMFLLTAYAARYVLTVYQLGGVYPVTRVPFYLVYSVAPLGFCLAGLQYLSRALGDQELASETPAEV